MLRIYVDAALDVVPNPPDDDVRTLGPVADPKDKVHVACAVEQGCSHLVTYNLRDYPPQYSGEPVDGLAVMTPGSLVRRIRARLSDLT